MYLCELVSAQGDEMTDETQVNQLLAGVEHWNRWRKEHREVRLDLIKANLSEANLIWADLIKADLSEANLNWANLSGANLSGANLSGANLIGANLHGADFSNADLIETVFGNTDLTDAKGLDTCIHHGPSTLDHRTLERSGELPLVFLRGCGLPEMLIDYLPSLFGKAINFYSCFISYSHANKSFASRLHDQLQGKGIRCWLDEHQMLPGDNILKQVDEGIRPWDKVLLCCSEASLTSWWVDKEIDKALDKERTLWEERREEVLALIPLNLDRYLFGDNWRSEKASIVKTRLAADFIGWEHDNDKFERAFDALVKALTTDNRGRQPPPKPKL